LARLIADAGALLAAERNVREIWALKKLAVQEDLELVVPAPVLAQVWRGRASANLARFLKGVAILDFTEQEARTAGELLAAARTEDVVDAAVAVCARRGDRVLTSGPGDIATLVELRGIDARVERV